MFVVSKPKKSRLDSIIFNTMHPRINFQVRLFEHHMRELAFELIYSEL